MQRHEMAVALIFLAAAIPAYANGVTGQWDFNDPNDGLAATVGRDGYYWIRPAQVGDPQSRSAFGTAASFGITPFPDGGDGGILKFADYSNIEGLEMYPGIEANGGGSYVNQFTVIYDVLYPSSSSAAYIALLQTNECNGNDGDIFGYKSAGNNYWGIGISGVYEGQLFQDQWHRVVLAFDLANARLDKYIDGALVGTQTLESGLDGRWALYTQTDNLPTLLFTDNDGETDYGYVSSVQIRDYPMTGTEVAALGGVNSAGIPGGAGVTGQWDFNGNLVATVGQDLKWFTYANCGGPGTCPIDLADTTEFGTSTQFGIPNLPDGPAAGMRFDAALPCNGYMLPHGAAANGGGAKVNQYTVIMDVYFTLEDYFTGITREIGGQVYQHSPNWIALYQTWPFNEGDAMQWIRTTDAALGDDGSYSGTEYWCLEETWLRIVNVVDCTGDAPTITKYVLYADDSHVGPVVQEGDGLDGKRALTTVNTSYEDVFLAFTDEDLETHRGFVNSIQIRDYLMTETEVFELGGPRAAGIPRPPVVACPGDTNCDGVVSFGDINPFVAGLTGGPLCNPANFDLNANGTIGFDDINPFVAYLSAHQGESCP